MDTGNGKQTAREVVARTRRRRRAARSWTTEGLDAVSMRRVGRELGVEAMSLYHHVHDKDDLLLGDPRAGALRVRRPGHARATWEDARARGRTVVASSLAGAPNVMVLISESKRFEHDADVDATDRDGAPAARARSGCPEDDAVKAFCALGGFIVGFVMFEIGVTHATGPMDAPPTPRDSWPRSLPTSSLASWRRFRT